MSSITTHWAARKMEWVLAGLSATWGLYTLLHPGMFTAEPSKEIFSGLARMTPWGLSPSDFWGWLAILVGTSRALALYINGAYVRTPVIRVIASFLTMFVFAQVSIGLWESGVANTGIVVYPWLVIADMISAYSAGRDAITADAERRIARGDSHVDRRRRRYSLAKS